MKKLITKLVLAIAVAALTSGTSFAAEGQNGNGGGGVNRNGRHMTFYSAGFYIEPNEQSPDQIPQLNQLIHFFSTTNLMSEQKKADFLKALIPAAKRQYYRVDSSKFTPEVRARLVAEYGRVMNINANEVALFGITDTQSDTTYLFPEFFSLKPIEQQAILFHEAYWLVYPRATYKQIVNAEMAFQAFLEYPQSSQRILNWIEKTGSHKDVLQAAITADLQSGAMNGLVDFKTKGPKSFKFSRNGTVYNTPPGASIPMLKLFGAKFFECRANGGGKNCRPFITTNAYALSQQYPNSLFLSIFSRAAAGVELSLNYCNTSSAFDYCNDSYAAEKFSAARLYIQTSSFVNGADLTVFSSGHMGFLQNIK